jgi:hypothetical protein
MRFVALTAVPADSTAAVKILCAATGQVPAEARMRMAGEPPLLIARLDDDAAQMLVAQLRSAKVAALSIDMDVPGDESRLVARSFVFGEAGAGEPGYFELQPRMGEPMRLPYEDIDLLVRGVRLHRSSTTHTESKRKLDLGRALLTQGLMITKVEKREVTTRIESPEHFLLVYSGESVGALYEEEVTFQSLGKDLQPARLANMGFITDKLRRLAPQAQYDDRLLRLGRRPMAFEGDPVDVVAEILRRSLASQ